MIHSMLSIAALPSLLFFSLLIPPPRRSTLFPYTTLFRSPDVRQPPGLILPHARDHRLGATEHPLRADRSEEHTSELQSPCNLLCRLLLENKKNSSKLDNNKQYVYKLGQ